MSDWVTYYTDSNIPYYYHTKTLETVWEKPVTDSRSNEAISSNSGGGVSNMISKFGETIKKSVPKKEMKKDRKENELSSIFATINKSNNSDVDNNKTKNNISNSNSSNTYTELQPKSNWNISSLTTWNNNKLNTIPKPINDEFLTSQPKNVKDIINNYDSKSNALVPPNYSLLSSSQEEETYYDKFIKSSKSSYNYIRTRPIMFGIITVCVLILIIGLAAGLSKTSNTTTTSTASQSINKVSDNIYNSQSNELVFDSSTLTDMTSQMNLIFGAFNTSFIVFSNAKPTDDISSLIQDVKNMISTSPSTKAFTGTSNLLGISTSCLIVLFYKFNETSFSSNNVQFVSQCTFSNSLNPSNIIVLNGWASWINDWQFIPSSSFIIFSSVSYVADEISTFDTVSDTFPSYIPIYSSIPAQSYGLPNFIGAGLNIVGTATRSTTANPSTMFSSVSRILGSTWTASTSAVIHVSIPIDPIYPYPYMQMSSTEPMRGLIALSSDVELKFTNSTLSYFKGNNVKLYVKGVPTTTLQALKFQSSIAIDFSSSVSVSGVLNSQLVASWNLYTNFVSAIGSLDSAWSPFKSASAPTLSISNGVLNFNASVSNNGLTISAASIRGNCLTSINSNPGLSLPTFVYFTSTDVMVWIGKVYFSNVVDTIKSYIKDQSLLNTFNRDISASLDSNVVYEVIISTFSLNSLSFTANGLKINPGLSILANGVELSTSSFNGAMDTLSQISPTSFAAGKGTFNIDLNIPIFTSAIKNFYLHTAVNKFSFASTSLVLNLNNVDLLFTYVSTVSTYATFTTSITASVTLSLPNLSGSDVTDIVVFGSASFSSTTKILTFQSTVSPFYFPLTKLGVNWMQINDIQVSGTFNFVAVPAVISATASLKVSLDFGLAPSTAPISVLAIFSSNGIIFRADNINIVKFIPDLASSVDGLVSVAIASKDFPEYGVKAGFNFFSSGFSFISNSFNGAYDLLSGDDMNGLASALTYPSGYLWPSNSAMNGYYNFFNKGVSISWNVPRLPLYKGQIWLQNITMSATGVLFPYPAHFSVNLNGCMFIDVPNVPSWVIPINSAVSSSMKKVAIYGVVPAWATPFNISWINLGKSDVAFIFDDTLSPATRTITLGSYASIKSRNFNFGLNVCGILTGGNYFSTGVEGGGFAFMTEGFSLSNFQSSLCDFLGYCDVVNALIPDLSNLKIAIGFSTIIISPAVWSRLLRGSAFSCSISTAVPQGISIFAENPLTGDYYNNFVGKIVPKSWIDGLSQKWVVAINMPLPNVYEKTLSFNVNYQNYMINYHIPNTGITILGGGIRVQINPTLFSIWTTLSINVQGHEQPLLFYVSGGVGVGVTGLILTGSMTMDAGWPEPFGIKGIIVYGVMATIGFSSTGAPTTFGVGFDLLLSADISVVFSGTISISPVSPCYVYGAVSSKTQRRLQISDFIEAINTISGGHLPIPSWLPCIFIQVFLILILAGNFMSFSYVAFSLATASGIDALGRHYPSGLYVFASFTFLALNVNLTIACGPSQQFQLWTNGPSVLDFALSLSVDFITVNSLIDNFNNKAVNWLSNFMKSVNLGTWIKSYEKRTVCDLFCLTSLSLNGFSVINFALGTMPTYSIKFKVLGKSYTFSGLVDIIWFQTSTVSDFLDQFKDDISFSGCLVDSDCGTGFCDAFSFTCKTSCPNCYSRLKNVGCVYDLSACSIPKPPIPMTY